VQWQGFRKLDPVTAAYAAAQAYAPVTLMSRLEVTLGSKVQIQAHPGYNSALPEERLTRSIVFNPAYASPNRLRMEVTAEYDASSSRRIAERLGGPAAVARLDAPGAKVVERTVHEVEPATGLTLYHEDRYQLVGGGAEFPLRTVRVTRLDRPEVK
jgi:hypothetical protein